MFALTKTDFLVSLFPGNCSSPLTPPTRPAISVNAPSGTVCSSMRLTLNFLSSPPHHNQSVNYQVLLIPLAKDFPIHPSTHFSLAHRHCCRSDCHHSPLGGRNSVLTGLGVLLSSPSSLPPVHSPTHESGSSAVLTGLWFFPAYNPVKRFPWS